MRMLFIGILMICVLSACRGSMDSALSPTVAPVSLPTHTPIPFKAIPKPSLTAVPLPEDPSEIEYSSVAEALAGLKTRDDVYIEVLKGWTIVKEADGFTNWSFVPPDHPAYPAVAKRALYRDQGGWHLKMDVLCEAEMAACDEFVKYFETLNEPIYQMIEQQQKP
jgi:hypothetical protein